MNPKKHSESSAPPPPPTFDPSKPSAPVSFPIKDLSSLASRAYFASFHYPFNVASAPLPKSDSLPPRRRLLVCHDMAGGYQDDKWVQGGNNPDAYAIWHWYLMDVFVYFSHNLVTLPPPCWTNTAHAHGVKVLGTFIAESDEGRAVCKTLLASEMSARLYAERLAELAAKLGFDGWLLNMEVRLELSQVPTLKEFVNHLTRTMHAAVPGSLVIWYDSVTIAGNLWWQNQLNQQNKPFFDLCDGIFVNYSWQENYPKLSADIAGERKFDVYMGIDVFGRNTFGGGKWNTNIALDVLKESDVSAAIFAPGWVYENKEPPDFQTAQNRWWGLVEKSWGILQNYPTVLPFYSNFDQGHGYHFSVEGLQVAADPWNNISCQGIQPLIDYSTDMQPIQAQFDFKGGSYSGGGSITFRGNLDDTAIFKMRLFRGKLPLEDLPVHISYSVRSEGKSLLGLSLVFSSNINGRRTSVLLADGRSPSLPTNKLANNFDQVVSQLPVKVTKKKYAVDPGWILQESSIKMSGYSLTEIHVVCYMKGKLGSNEPVLEQDLNLEKINTTTHASSTFYASLGHVSIQTSQQNELPPAASWVIESQNVSWGSASEGAKSVSTKIMWMLKNGTITSFMKYNIYVEKVAKQTDAGLGDTIASDVQFLGAARVEMYYVSNLEVPNGVSGIRFIIQVCGLDGACQKLDESPAFLLAVED